MDHQELFRRCLAQATAAMDQAWTDELTRMPADYHAHPDLIDALRVAFGNGFNLGGTFAAEHILRERRRQA